MASGILNIDLDAICANWRALDGMSGPGIETGAVVKANGYGLGAQEVATALSSVGVRQFFVATCEEGAALRSGVGHGARIFIFSGHMAGDGGLISEFNLTPLLNSAEQIKRHFDELPDAAFGVQLDTGMNRLGMEDTDWQAFAAELLAAGPKLVMSHLACADETNHEMNERQLGAFKKMTDGISAPRSLAATGGVLLGPDYHFNVTRPGVGLYGGLPFEDAFPVISLKLPVIQIRDVNLSETVGYGNQWVASQPTRIATVAAGYADGLIRAMGGKARVRVDGADCAVVGRVSMDLLTIDVSHLQGDPEWVEILGIEQTVDKLADMAGTIGYEILTSLGQRYTRHYVGGPA